MKNQEFRILSVLWREPISAQSVVEVSTQRGQVFAFFCTSGEFHVGDCVRVEYFTFESDDDWDAVFSGNPQHEVRLVRHGERSYYAKGHVVEIEGHDLIVDCGGILLPLVNMSSDQRCIGAWVGFHVDFLEGIL